MKKTLILFAVNVGLILFIIRKLRIKNILWLIDRYSSRYLCMSSPHKEPDYQAVRRRAEEFNEIYNQLYGQNPGFIKRIFLVIDFFKVCAKDHPDINYSRWPSTGLK